MRAKQEDIDADRARFAQGANQFKASLTSEQRDALEQVVVAAIAQLPDPIRSAFLLRHIHGKSRAETARRLGISCRRVDERLTEGLRRVMDYVGSENLGPQGPGGESGFDGSDPGTELDVVGSLGSTGHP